MQSVNFPLATGFLRAPKDWSENARLSNGYQIGPCETLPFRTYVDGDLLVTQSFWIPTPEELVAISQMLNGAWALKMDLIGGSHPPVKLSIESLGNLMRT